MRGRPHRRTGDALELRHDEEAGVFELRTDPAAPPAEARRLAARMFDWPTSALSGLGRRRPATRTDRGGPPESPAPAVPRAVRRGSAGHRRPAGQRGRRLHGGGPPGPEISGAPSPRIRLPRLPGSAAFLAAGPGPAARPASPAPRPRPSRRGRGRARRPPDEERLRALPAAEAQAALVALPGIGPWTASYLRMRRAGDRDAFPASDLGVLKACEPCSPSRSCRRRRPNAEPRRGAPGGPTPRPPSGSRSAEKRPTATASSAERYLTGQWLRCTFEP